MKKNTLTLVLTVAVCLLVSFSCSAGVRPATGDLIMGDMVEGEHEVDLLVENGLSVDAVVIITPLGASSPIERAVYVRSGESFGLRHLRRGDAWVYFMTGTDWDPDKNEFLQGAMYERFDEEFDFGLYSYSVTLHSVEDGNLGTEHINPAKFPTIK